MIRPVSGIFKRGRGVFPFPYSFFREPNRFHLLAGVVIFMGEKAPPFCLMLTARQAMSLLGILCSPPDQLLCNIPSAAGNDDII